MYGLKYSEEQDCSDGTDHSRDPRSCGDSFHGFGADRALGGGSSHRWAPGSYSNR